MPFSKARVRTAFASAPSSTQLRQDLAPMPMQPKPRREILRLERPSRKCSIAWSSALERRAGLVDAHLRHVLVAVANAVMRPPAGRHRDGDDELARAGRIGDGDGGAQEMRPRALAGLDLVLERDRQR